LLIVAGRNKPLEKSLRETQWNQPTTIYGFVDFMPRLMAASDMIVTKAGPATIMEACTAGLPLIISGAIPGQEIGNVEYVVKNNAGVLAKGTQAIADTVQAWLEEPDALAERSRNAHALAYPDAVWKIIDEIHNCVIHEPAKI
jgi:1,2-diacylglycerol 3-beta-galactosyltransferase